MFHIRSAICYENDMGTKRLETVFDYSKAGCDIAVLCACGHAARLDPKAVAGTCIAKGLDTRMLAIRQRLKCSACGSREVKCSPMDRA